MPGRADVLMCLEINAPPDLFSCLGCLQIFPNSDDHVEGEIRGDKIIPLSAVLEITYIRNAGCDNVKLRACVEIGETESAFCSFCTLMAISMFYYVI